MIRVRQVEVPINQNTIDNIKKACSKKLKVEIYKIQNINIHKQSIDARKKPDLYYIYELDVNVIDEDKILNRYKNNDIFMSPNEEYKFNITGTNKIKNRPIIVGSGPAGLFAGYMLSKNGYKPLIIERGENVDDRVKTVENFWRTGELNINSNVQFGEGGAGTFSDGKLNTQVKDTFFRGKEVLDVFVSCGADESIKYVNKPHIGTDLLRNVVKNLRNKIIDMGGEFKYNTCLTNINIKNNTIESIEINNSEIVPCEILVLAIGHSARDTFKMLYDKNVPMNSKPFAMGIRIQHKQEIINLNQYGKKDTILGAASYKLVHTASNGRGVYSFCMCPGGFVVNSSSEVNCLAINGMSNNDRKEENANSAIVVTIGPKDFGEGALDGVEFQRQIEKKAFDIGKSKIPTQLFRDYKLNKPSTSLGKINPIFKGNYELANINDIFPDYLNQTIKEGIEAFGYKIKGFNDDDAIISAVESRTSSPVRIIRNEEGESDILGLYPCGEGAGYAGGITSAAMDGIKIAEDIAKKYCN